MSFNSHNLSGTSGVSPAEETLRLVASLPAPEGIEERIHETLRTAPRRGTVLTWPAPWMRAAAAAAIAFVVAGGGWGIYSRVQPGQPAVPAHVAVPGGFSGAGAIRTPQTLAGPVVSHPAKAQPAQPKTQKKKAAARKSASQTDARKAAVPQVSAPAQ
jgi:hypothetical protein